MTWGKSSVRYVLKITNAKELIPKKPIVLIVVRNLGEKTSIN
ncbi:MULTISPECIES: hypothetical protein [Moorena]|nr:MULTISPECIES: hypothetical protein [Moorena]